MKPRLLAIDDVNIEKPLPESPKQPKKSDAGATLPPLTGSFDGSQKGLLGLTASPKGSKGTPKNRRRSNSFDRHSSERKKLPKPSENPSITMDKFVGTSVVQVEDRTELLSYVESRDREDDDQFERGSDNEVERLLNE